MAQPPCWHPDVLRPITRSSCIVVDKSNFKINRNVQTYTNRVRPQSRAKNELGQKSHRRHQGQPLRGALSHSLRQLSGEARRNFNQHFPSLHPYKYYPADFYTAQTQIFWALNPNDVPRPVKEAVETAVRQQTVENDLTCAIIR